MTEAEHKANATKLEKDRESRGASVKTALVVAPPGRIRSRVAGEGQPVGARGFRAEDGADLPPRVGGEEGDGGER